MSKKLQKILQEKLLISNVVELQIEKLMKLEYKELDTLNKITLHRIVKQRYNMVGKSEA